MNNKMEKFEIMCLIGEGSFGKVYKASNKANGNTVALKIIRKCGRSARELMNFHRECEIQQNLKHPNIIRMLDSFDTPSQMVVVTQFAQEDLHSILAKDGSLGEEKSRMLTWDLASALYYLHSHRILHRDLKPQNILQGEDKKFKVCDFGLACTMSTGTHVLTSIKGTPLYMAPELMAEQPYDHQADLWSLGCIIYEALVGEPPFSTTSILHLIQLIKYERVRWPSFISEECISFLQGLLQKNPLDRLSWQQILIHSFVDGHILILDETPGLPFANPLKRSQEEAKKHQFLKAIENRLCAMPIIQHDEIKTDSECSCSIALENESANSCNSVKNTFDKLSLTDTLKTDKGTTDIKGNNESEIETISGLRIATNPLNIMQKYFTCNLKLNNLFINNMNSSNTEDLSYIVKIQTNNSLSKIDFPSLVSQNDVRKNIKHSDINIKKSILEKRKLSQNLDNFSLMLEQSDNKIKKSLRNMSLTKSEGMNYNFVSNVSSKNKKNRICSISKIGKDRNDSRENKTITYQGYKETISKIFLKDEDKSHLNACCEPLDTGAFGIEQPIENEEWLAFIHNYIQEVLEGDEDSLKQKNLVSFIISPLRYNWVSSEVTKRVAQLLAIPLVVLNNPTNLEIILKVYYDVKLVANLVYASVLIFKRKESLRQSQLTLSDVSAFENMYLLVCHLVHSSEQFASQFCDAIVILSAKNYMQELITPSNESVALTSDIIAILTNVMCSLPENAQLVESIVLESGLNRILNLLSFQDNLLRLRTCNLMRLLGRFSCAKLQSYWCANVREKLEILLEEDDVDLSMTAEETIAELKSLSFYQK